MIFDPKAKEVSEAIEAAKKSEYHKKKITLQDYKENAPAKVEPPHEEIYKSLDEEQQRRVTVIISEYKRRKKLTPRLAMEVAKMMHTLPLLVFKGYIPMGIIEAAVFKYNKECKDFVKGKRKDRGTM